MFKDTRLLPPEAAKLYAGVRAGREGTTMLMHSKMEAFDMLARHLGAYESWKQPAKRPASLADWIAELPARSVLPIVDNCPDPG